MEEKYKTWDFDQETLDEAWKEWSRLPVADRRERFGQYFLNRFQIRGLISWPSLFYEDDPATAYRMLAELANGIRG